MQNTKRFDETMLAFFAKEYEYPETHMLDVLSYVPGDAVVQFRNTRTNEVINIPVPHIL